MKKAFFVLRLEASRCTNGPRLWGWEMWGLMRSENRPWVQGVWFHRVTCCLVHLGTIIWLHASSRRRHSSKPPAGNVPLDLALLDWWTVSLSEWSNRMMSVEKGLVTVTIGTLGTDSWPCPGGSPGTIPFPRRWLSHRQTSPTWGGPRRFCVRQYFVWRQ